MPYESWLRNDLKDVVWGVLTDRKTMSEVIFVRTRSRACSEPTQRRNYSKEIFSL